MNHPAPIRFDAWVAAVFAGHYPEAVGISSLEVIDDSGWVVEYATRLFTGARRLPDAFSPRELRVGLDTLLRAWGIADAVWCSEIPVSQRRTLLASMLHLFSDVFAHDPLGSTCEMWWDSLRPHDDEPHYDLQDDVMRVLEQILHMPQIHCQYAALHGLGHLRHVRRSEVIHSWIQASKSLDPDLRKYALQAAEGGVL